MTEKEISLILAYLYNNKLHLERELKQRQSNIRYRDIDVVDCLELALCSERCSFFNQISNDIRILLNLK